MLSPDQVASQGPGGFLSLNGGPTDPYYALADGSAYPDDATACAVVPVPARRNRTINVAGIEKWWQESDLSDGGLIPKSAAVGPGYVDEVVEYDNLAAFPTMGVASKLYIARDTNKQYRWSGTAYVLLSDSGITVNQKAGLDGSNTSAADPLATRSQLVWVRVGATGSKNIAKEPIKSDTIFRGSYFSNVFGFNISGCDFGTTLNNNVFGDGQFGTTTGAGFSDNILGSNLRDINFGTSCTFNEIGNGASAIRASNRCSRNIFAPGVIYVELGDDCLGNKIDDGCLYVRLEAGCERVQLINCGRVGYSSGSPFTVPAGTKDVTYRNNVLVVDNVGGGNPGTGAAVLYDDHYTATVAGAQPVITIAGATKFLNVTVAGDELTHGTEFTDDGAGNLTILAAAGVVVGDVVQYYWLTGSIGAPGVIPDDSITEPKLSPAVRAKLNAIASGGAAVLREYRLSNYGINDAASLEFESQNFGGLSATQITQNTAAIQAVFDIAGPKRIIWDVRTPINTTLFIGSYTTLTFADGCGWIVAPGTNKKALMNKNPVGMTTAPNGELVLAPRVDTSIVLEYGICNYNGWLGDNPQQRYGNEQAGTPWTMGIHFAGVQNLQIFHLQQLNQRSFSMMLTNCKNIYIDNLYCRSNGMRFQSDGLKLIACENVLISKIHGSCGDDLWSINANDGLFPDLNSTAYDPYAVFGPCTNITILETITEGGYGGRICSADGLVSGINIGTMKGWTNVQGLIIGETVPHNVYFGSTGQFAKQRGGNYDNITVDNYAMQNRGKQYYAGSISIGGDTGMRCNRLVFNDVYRTYNQLADMPTFDVLPGAHVTYFELNNSLHIWDNANISNAVIDNFGTIDNLNARNIRLDRASGAMTSGPFLRNRSTGTVNGLKGYNFDAYNTTYVIENSGTVQFASLNQIEYNSANFWFQGAGRVTQRVVAYGYNPDATTNPFFAGLGTIQKTVGGEAFTAASYNAQPVNPNQYVRPARYVVYNDAGSIDGHGDTQLVGNPTSLDGGMMRITPSGSTYVHMSTQAGVTRIGFVGVTSSAQPFSFGVYANVNGGGTTNVPDLTISCSQNNPNGSDYPWEYGAITFTGAPSVELYLSGFTGVTNLELLAIN